MFCPESIKHLKYEFNQSLYDRIFKGFISN